MPTTPKILAFAGSARKDSWNKKLLAVAVNGARAAGAEVTVADLRDFPMPLYDGDLEQEQGLPATVLQMRELMLAHHGFLIASPEYNSSISPLLKNTLDWTTRAGPGQDGMAPYRNKVVVLMSASPGGFGGLRGLVHVRAIFGNLGCIVLPDQLAVGTAQQAFTEDGAMVNPKQQAAVENLGHTLATTLARLSCQPLLEAQEERRHDASRMF